jgi:hypothetical protein
MPWTVNSIRLRLASDGPLESTLVLSAPVAAAPVPTVGFPLPDAGLVVEAGGSRCFQYTCDVWIRNLALATAARTSLRWA